MSAVEANFDGLVGPTHNYAGLSFGNVASERNQAAVSNPREAALQGLRKMRALADMGLAQGILPPQERPHIPTLRRLGFFGNDEQVLAQAQYLKPQMLAAVSSASCMWTANAATVSPSADTADGRIHFTPANLCGNLHRSIEPEVTARVLQAVFADYTRFAHHAPLPATPDLGDEGAANHTRFCNEYDEVGLEFFVYGRDAASGQAPKRFPARQTRLACETVARLHELPENRVVYAQQHPKVVDQGVFHNDVIAVGNRNVLLYHQQAFLNSRQVIRELREGFPALVPIQVPTKAVTVSEAVDSYLFNSQLVCPPEGGMIMIVAQECQQSLPVWRYIQQLIADDNPITDVHVHDLRQSMRNGGGPACLRLRVVLNEPERAAVNPNVWMTPQRHEQMEAWVTHHYRDRLSVDDLADPELLVESRTALDELTQLLGLGSVYDFQRD